mmetsp:Transcript_18125/g.30962  ORF Transcript_18125/g.30962 Transcript_18125/m.30962 type:complete len:200 (-) Transcript_18125:1119-1718(-)
MKQAFKMAEHLRKVGEECLDGFSKFDLQAYIEVVQAQYLIQTERWQEALDLLLLARTKYAEIQKYKDSMEAVFYEERISMINTFTRLCQYNLTMRENVKNVDSLIQKKQQELESQLQDKVLAAFKQTRTDKFQNYEEIEFNGKKIPLKSDRMIEAFKRINSHEQQIEELKQQIQQQKLQDKNQELIGLYHDFMNLLDQA